MNHDLRHGTGKKRASTSGARSSEGLRNMVPIFFLFLFTDWKSRRLPVLRGNFPTAETGGGIPPRQSVLKLDAKDSVSVVVTGHGLRADIRAKYAHCPLGTRSNDIEWLQEQLR